MARMSSEEWIEEQRRKQIVANIKQRILDEQKKHPDLDWAEIAARKIYSAYLAPIE